MKHKFTYKPTLETLEDRTVPSGNVRASLLPGGTLSVTGDRADNEIQITSLASGSVTLTGDSGTLIDGAPSRTITGVTKGMRFLMGRGDDKLYFGAPAGALNTINGDLRLDMGQGTNEVYVGKAPDASGRLGLTSLVDIKGNLSVTNYGGGGAGSVYLYGVAVDGNVNVDLGKGPADKNFVLDRWGGGQSDLPGFIRDSVVQGAVGVTAQRNSIGDVDVHIIYAHVVRGVSLQTGSGSDYVTFARAEITGDVNIDTGAGSDLILFTDTIIEAARPGAVAPHLTIVSGVNNDSRPHGQEAGYTEDSDQILFTGGQFDGNVTIQTGDRMDEVDFIRPEIGGDVKIDAGIGKDYITIGALSGSAGYMGHIGGNVEITAMAQWPDQGTDVQISNVEIKGDTTINLRNHGGSANRNYVAIATKGFVSTRDLTVSATDVRDFLDLVVGNHDPESASFGSITVEALTNNAPSESPNNIQLLGGRVYGATTVNTGTHPLDLEIADMHFWEAANLHGSNLHIANAIFYGSVDVNSFQQIEAEGTRFESAFTFLGGDHYETVRLNDCDFIADATFYGTVNLLVRSSL